MIKHHHSNKTIPADIVRRHPFANPLAEGGGCATMHKNKEDKQMGRKLIDPKARAKQVSVSLPAHLVEKIESTVKQTGLKRSTVISHALSDWFGIERFIN